MTSIKLLIVKEGNDTFHPCVVKLGYQDFTVISFLWMAREGGTSEFGRGVLTKKTYAEMQELTTRIGPSANRLFIGVYDETIVDLKNQPSLRKASIGWRRHIKPLGDFFK